MSLHRMCLLSDVSQVVDGLRGDFIKGEVTGKTVETGGFQQLPVVGDDKFCNCPVDFATLLQCLKWTISANGQYVCYHTENRSEVCQFNA